MTFCHPLTLSSHKMMPLDRIPDQTGYLVLTEDGAVLTSGGDLENDERVANIIVGLVTLTNGIDPKAFPAPEAFEKISITYKDHCYVICLSNKKIHVVKRKLPLPTAAIIEQQSIVDV
ncbi:PREDICTED: ragulator complex protein LAMTOR4 homolog isoform X1 [Dinoponera quadriceps]|uniref:Late endosomal/lysosomal adaptor and MAPK and MTOR activator 4 n=2 Tax=Dinoponera quadriceps TaxID=609295 RepID=A0A6P3X5F1_DINQU|nr:PREDICTED: ragulator complex protein LAMTOR4 homolog isoform X1 [Dinoponera quadriceps]